MSVDLTFIVNAANAAISGLTALFIALGLYRAIEIGRLLVGRVYKSRALWTAGLLGAGLFFLANTSPIPYVSFGGGEPGVIVMTFALLLFINSNIRVAKEMDFFHRDILRWEVVGRPVFALTAGSGLLSVLVVLLYPSVLNSGASDTPLWVTVGIFQFFAVWGATLCLGAAGLIIGARRTPDVTMKKFVRMVGLSLVCFALFFTIWIPLSIISMDLGNVVSSLFGAAAAYYIYRAAISLSPLGKVEKGAKNGDASAVTMAAPL